MEQGEQLLRRDELLAARGERADQSNKGGVGKYVTGAKSAPVKTTSSIAAEMGVSERVAQQRKQIARDIVPSLASIFQLLDFTEQFV